MFLLGEGWLRKIFALFNLVLLLVCVLSLSEPYYFAVCVGGGRASEDGCVVSWVFVICLRFGVERTVLVFCFCGGGLASEDVCGVPFVFCYWFAFCCLKKEHYSLFVFVEGAGFGRYLWCFLCF